MHHPFIVTNKIVECSQDTFSLAVALEQLQTVMTCAEDPIKVLKCTDTGDSFHINQYVYMHSRGYGYRSTRPFNWIAVLRVTAVVLAASFLLHILSRSNPSAGTVERV